MSNKDLISKTGSFLDKYKNYFTKVDSSHAYRYVHLVKTSSQGEECKYAKASLRLWESGLLEKEMIELETMYEDLRHLISFYKDTSK